MDCLCAWRRWHTNGWCSEVRELEEGVFILLAIDRPGQELLNATTYPTLKAAAAAEQEYLQTCSGHARCSGCGEWEPLLVDTVSPRFFR